MSNYHEDEQPNMLPPPQPRPCFAEISSQKAYRAGLDGAGLALGLRALEEQEMLERVREHKP